MDDAGRTAFAVSIGDESGIPAVDTPETPAAPRAFPVGFDHSGEHGHHQRRPMVTPPGPHPPHGSGHLGRRPGRPDRVADDGVRVLPKASSFTHRSGDRPRDTRTSGRCAAGTGGRRGGRRGRRGAPGPSRPGPGRRPGPARAGPRAAPGRPDQGGEHHQDVHGHGHPAVGGRTPAATGRPGGALATRRGPERPGDHRPDAAQPHQRDLQLHRRPGVRAAAARRHRPGLDPVGADRGRHGAPAGLRPRSGLVVQQHQLPADRPDPGAGHPPAGAGPGDQPDHRAAPAARHVLRHHPEVPRQPRPRLPVPRPDRRGLVGHLGLDRLLGLGRRRGGLHHRGPRRLLPGPARRPAAAPGPAAGDDHDRRHRRRVRLRARAVRGADHLRAGLGPRRQRPGLPHLRLRRSGRAAQRDRADQLGTGRGGRCDPEQPDQRGPVRRGDPRGGREGTGRGSVEPSGPVPGPPPRATLEQAMSTEIPDSYRDLLQAPVATLATIDPDGRPQLSAVWFLAEGDEIRTSLNTVRQKVANLRRNPAVNLFILDPANPYRYLEIRGDAELEDDPDYAFADRLGAKYGADVRTFEGPGSTRLVVTIRPTRVNAVTTGG